MDPQLTVWITFGVYMVLLLGIGIWGDRRFGQTYDGFVTANRSLGAWVAAISSAASSESAWVMLGLSGLGYKQGIAAYWAAIGCTLGFLVAAIWVVVQLRRSSGKYQVTTLADYFEGELGDPKKIVRGLSSLLIIFFLLAYVVAQFVGTGKQMDGMGLLDYRTGVAVGAGIIGIYVLLGGYAAVCYTDMVQGILMAAVMVIFPILALFKAGGVGPVWEALSQNNITSFCSGGQGLTWAAIGFAVGQIGIGIGYPGMPHSIIRWVTVKDDKEARSAAIISVGYGLLVLFGAVTLGMVGRALLPDLADPEKILPAFTAQFFHPVIGGVILAAISAAIMSTADSQLIMAATSAVHDLWYTIIKKDRPDERTMVIQTRVVVGVLAAIAMGLALIEPQVIYTFVLFAWGALGASFTPVTLLTLHWKRLTWQGATASFITGPVTVIVWKLIPGASDFLYEMIPACAVSTVAAVIVSKMTKK